MQKWRQGETQKGLIYKKMKYSERWAIEGRKKCLCVWVRMCVWKKEIVYVRVWVCACAWVRERERSASFLAVSILCIKCILFKIFSVAFSFSLDSCFSFSCTKMKNFGRGTWFHQKLNDGSFCSFTALLKMAFRCTNLKQRYRMHF